MLNGKLVMVTLPFSIFPPVGVTYICWGRTSRPDTEETEILYEGKAAGKFYNQRGGSNYLCLTDDQVPLLFTAGHQPLRISNAC